MSRLHKKHSLLDLFKRRLKNLPINLDDHLSLAKKTVSDQVAVWKDNTKYQVLSQRISELEIAKNNYNLAVQELDDDINKLLQEKEKRIIQRDYNRVNTYEAENTVLRNSWLSAKIKDVCSGVIQANTFWQYASLEINPGDGCLSQLMNAADPQYCIVADSSVEKQVKSKFNEFYSTRRLRCYSSLDKIPDATVGFASCINLYEYLPLENIKEISTTTFTKLKPGGKFLITYNDCEQRYSLELLDNEFRCLATKTLISSLHFGLGYDVLDSGNTDNGTWSYMVLQKPGELTSQKLASPQVEFVPKFVPYAVWPSELRELVEAKKSRSSVQWRGDVMAYYQPAWNNLKTSVHKYIDTFYHTNS